MVARLWNTTQHYRRAFVTLSGPGRMWVVNAEHRLLLDAVERRDPVDAERPCRPHPAHPHRTGRPPGYLRRLESRHFIDRDDYEASLALTSAPLGLVSVEPSANFSVGTV